MKKLTEGVDWGYYDDPKFEEVDNKYLPARGEGDTMASQIVVAVNKLVYKWYNDGDVFDNTYGMKGWANDLSSYANWLINYVPETESILKGIYDCSTDDDYEELLKDLADMCCDMNFLDEYSTKKKVGSVYKCEGPFLFKEEEDDDEWDWDNEDEEW